MAATSSGAVIARIISQYSDKGSKAAQKDIAKLGKQIDVWSKKVVKSYAIAGAAVAAFAIKIGKDAVQGAMEDQKQQAALATALRNTTGATDAAIKANQEYLDQLELQVAIDNDQLIPALQKLVTATGDLAQGQSLLSLATDVSVASGKDLNSVAIALSKAVNGNVGALKKLNLPLDENALKAGNLGKLLEDLAILSAGQASKASETFAGQMEKLRLTFNQVLDKLGYALIPVIEDFARYIITDVIPNLEEWIDINENKLKDSFKGLLDTIASIVKNLVQLTFFFEKYKELVLIIAAIPVLNVLGTQALIIARVGKIIAGALGAIRLAHFANLFKNLATAVGLVTGAFRAGGFLAAVKGAVDLFMMLNPYVRGVAIAIGLVTAGVSLWNRLTNKTGEIQKANAAQLAKDQQNAILNGFKQIEVATEAAKQETARKNALKKLAAEQAKADAAAKKRAKFEADYEKINKRIAASYGVKLLSSEEEKMVAINAAEALLKRQKESDDANKERLKDLKEELLSLKVRNDLADRYVDILRVIADEKITDKEIQALALGWKMPVEAVKAYLTQFQAVSDGKISDDEIINLAKQWGSTQAQAAQYLDFFYALNDGVLDDSEIEKLKAKWKLTEDQVRMYADFVGIVNDGKLTDAEIIKIKDKWKLTTDQVVDYIKKIGSPVTYSGTLIDPAKAAEIGWLNAAAALQRYLDLLKAGTGVIINGGTPANPVVPVVPVIPTTPGGLPESQTPDGSASRDSHAAAIVYAVAKAAGDMETAAKAAAQVNPSTLAAGESGAIGAASIAAQLKAAEEQVAYAATIAGFKAKEAADAAASVQATTSREYDERFRFQSSTVNTAAGISSTSSSAPINVTVNVAGSVSTEQDLVSAVRTGLLQTQYNGNALLLQAI